MFCCCMFVYKANIRKNSICTGKYDNNRVNLKTFGTSVKRITAHGMLILAATHIKCIEDRYWRYSRYTLTLLVMAIIALV